MYTCTTASQGKLYTQSITCLLFLISVINSALIIYRTIKHHRVYMHTHHSLHWVLTAMLFLLSVSTNYFHACMREYDSFQCFSSVTGTPQNVEYVQTGDSAVNVSWSPPQGDSNNLYYSVFIKTPDENITRVKYVADTSVALTGLKQGEAYNIDVIVVATKPSSRTTLPSFPQTIKITLGKLNRFYR